LGDVRGSTAVAVTKGGVGVQVQWYDPYGAPRGLPAIVGTDRGYLGQYEDTATALGYLNNRYTDPTLGIFLSVDPLVATTSDPYLYANGNPTTLSDPSGLERSPVDPDNNAAYGRMACSRMGGSYCSGGSGTHDAGRSAVAATLQPGEPGLGDQLGNAQAMGLSFWDFDGSWTEWYARINVFYWVHRLVQADISGRSEGLVRTEYSGCGHRIDLCTFVGAFGTEVAELKFLGGRTLDVVRNSASRQLDAAMAALGANPATLGGPWPTSSGSPIVLGPMSVSWMNQNGGLYTYSVDRGWPTLPAWRAVKATANLPALEAALAHPPSSAINWGPIGGVVTGIGWVVAAAVGGAVCAGTGAVVCPAGGA
jgi:RHS repeat-associated protein